MNKWVEIYLVFLLLSLHVLVWGLCISYMHTCTCDLLEIINKWKGK
jgi:hypothetical protein